MSGGSGTGTRASGAISAPSGNTGMLADLEVFFNTNEFAIASIYTPTIGTALVVNVIFNKEYDAMSAVGGFRYFIQAKTSDFAAARPNETIVIDSVTYKIKGPPHHTGDGTSEIELSID